MWEDPIVAEIHKVRERIAAKYNFDIGAFFADLRLRQEALGDRLVRVKDRVEPNAEADVKQSSTSSGSKDAAAA